MGGGRCPSPHARVHPPESVIEDVFQLVQREIGDIELADLRDDRESLACHDEVPGELDLAGTCVGIVDASELIDWVKILHHWGVPLEALEKVGSLTELPYWQLLFKHQQDVHTVARHGNAEAPA